MASVGLLRKSRIIQLLVILFGINLQGNLINGQQSVKVIPEQVIVKESGSTNVTCKINSPITFCIFELNGIATPIRLNNEYNVDGIRYFGAGLANGECGIAIDRVSNDRNGKVKCTLGFEGPPGLLTGEAELIVARVAEPQLQIDGDRSGILNTESPLIATCHVENARPQAVLEWFLDDKYIKSNIPPSSVVTDSGDFTTSQQLQYRLTPEDDGKLLICKAVQFPDDSENRITKQQLNIQYAPVQEQDFRVYGLDLGQTAIINVTIRANPQPKVQWTVNGNTISEGQRNSRYSANSPISLGNGFYNVTFVIGGLTLEDTTTTYYIRAANQHGSRDYTVKISSSDKPLTAQGLEVGAIVGIVVACAVLILVVLLVVFARLTGRWCFSGATLNTDIGPDSEAQIHPNQHDDLDGKDFEGEENIDTRPQSEEVTPPVTDKLEAQKKSDIKNGQQHQNGKDAKSNTPV